MRDRSFLEDVGYVVLDSQWELFDKIIDNLNADKRSQTILAPNGGGKTSMSLLLALKFHRDGQCVLHYNGEPNGIDPQYASTLMRAPIETFMGIDFAGYNTISKYKQNHYDIVIIDSVYGALDAFSLSNEKGFSKSLERARENQESGIDLSLGQISIIALHELSTIIKKNSSFVINFELNKISDIGFTPVLASENVITDVMTQEEYRSYTESVNLELDAIFKSKKEEALKGALTPEKGRQFDEAVSEVMDYMAQIRQELMGEFRLLNRKVDEIKNDTEDIIATIHHLEETVNDRRNILDIFFSTESKDENSSELFITKITSMITKDISSQIEKLSNNQQYHVAEELVRLKIGANTLTKMNHDSIRFLVTAKYLFNQNMNLGADIDYSSVCLLASKAFELELSKRFITSYQDFLKQKGLVVRQWPSEMKKTIFSNNETETVPVTIEDFTLGKCPFIMGLKGRRQEREENKRYFGEYCKVALMKGLSDRDIENKNREFDGYIKNVKDKYRNPAAHKKAIGLQAANECLEYILEVERVLKIMLETYRV